AIRERHGVAPESTPDLRPRAADDPARHGAGAPAAGEQVQSVGDLAGEGPSGAPPPGVGAPIRCSCTVVRVMETQKLSFEDFKNIIVERLGCEPEQVTMDASFQEDLNADSLDLVELIYAFEENTGLEIPDEDAEKITTVRQAG